MATPYVDLIFNSQPEIVYQARESSNGALPASIPARENNFFRGVQWSPDGACLLTARDDQCFRVYDLPEDALERPACGGAGSPGDPPWGSPPVDNWKAELVLHGGQYIYDYAWYPGMSAADPATCVFAHTGKGRPIQLQDACTGQLRGSYRGYNDKDEITAAYSVAFSPDGLRLYAGYNKAVRVFELQRPGRDYLQIDLASNGGPRGIVSCFETNPFEPSMLALGCYSRHIAIMDAGTMEVQYVLGPTQGGITQVRFSRDGNYLYSGARQDPYIYCWDVRNTCEVLYGMERDSARSTQRIQFDIEPCGRHLATGGQDGRLHVYDLATGLEAARFPVSGDTLNGLQFHPFLPLAATASGDRNTFLWQAAGFESPCSPSTSSDSSDASDASDGPRYGRDTARASGAARRAEPQKRAAPTTALMMLRFPFAVVEGAETGGGQEAAKGPAAPAGAEDAEGSQHDAAYRVLEGAGGSGGKAADGGGAPAEGEEGFGS